MKIKDGFILRTVASQTVVLPVSGDLDLNMMIKLNDVGRFLWEKLQNDTSVDELVREVLKNYDIDEVTAREHINKFIEGLEKNGFLC